MKARMEIRLQEKMKSEFIELGGDSNVVRTLIEDWIVRTNNLSVQDENPNAIWNYSNLSVQQDMSVQDNLSVQVDTNKLFNEKTYEVLKAFKVFEKRSGRLIKSYTPKLYVKKSIVKNKELFRFEEVL